MVEKKWSIKIKGKKFSPKIRSEVSKVKKFLDDLAQQENPYKTAKKLKGEKNIWRYRIGKIRIIDKINDNQKTIFIDKINFRKDIYRNIKKTKPTELSR